MSVRELAASDNFRVNNAKAHMNMARTHVESAMEIIEGIVDPLKKIEAEKLLDFITEVKHGR